MATNDLTPRKVPPVETKYRRIQTDIPVPESIPILEDLRRFEPLSMSGQPPIIWDRAEGVQVFDRWGNVWLDWSSGVLVTNAGHSHPAVRRGDSRSGGPWADPQLLFPLGDSRPAGGGVCPRGARRDVENIPLDHRVPRRLNVALKLARTNGEKVGGDKKIGIVTFQNAFHGRTMGSQMAGGIPSLKQWIVNLDKDMVQVPFPDGFRCPDTSFDLFLKSLDEQGVTPEMVAGVMTETYQGGNASFAPPEYIQKLRAWCDEHNVVLIFDEVQAGFGRTGTYWGFEHYGVLPDLIACGKGISSGMPLSAVIGRPEIMDLYPPGSMTSTHTGNPICAAGRAGQPSCHRRGRYGGERPADGRNPSA